MTKPVLLFTLLLAATAARAQTNVGIGTTTPSEKLSVGSATTASPLSVSVQNSNGQGRFGISNVAGDYFAPQAGDLMINCNTTGKGIGLSVANVSTAPVYVSAAGKVGINMTAPSANLHVVGTMRLVDGNQAANRVLTSDASGNATWQAVPVVSHLRSVIITPKDFMVFNGGVGVGSVGGWAMSSIQFPAGVAVATAATTVAMPSDWNGSTISSVKLLYSSPNTSGTFTLNVYLAPVSAGAPISQSPSGYVSNVPPSTGADVLMEVSEPVVNIVAGTRLLNLRVIRSGTYPTDTNTGVLNLYGVKIEYND